MHPGSARLWRFLLALPLMVFTGLPVIAQESASGTPAEQAVRQALPTPIVVFDRSRVIGESETGRRLEARVQEARDRVLAENEALYNELETEERAISQARSQMTDEAFRARADAFDEKVTESRAQQAQKAEAVQDLYDTGLQALEARMNTVLADIANEIGAIAVFERQQVYLVSGGVDITQVAISRLDAMIESDGDIVEGEEDSPTEAPPEPEQK
ncbi:OmpH family outer membrane protein [Celeribacter arenosi]|uniref:Periplasmic chaperone for outer membrane proteins Skp n=1 Tax=Celeribacter arenosi TaxID=792649 RepID=A0ABP7KFJ8_9RHOB